MEDTWEKDLDFRLSKRVFQNPHVIYATTRVNSFTIFLLSLFYCRQNLCQVNRQFFRRNEDYAPNYWRIRYETLFFFRFKKAGHRYWKLINYALTWARPNLLLSLFMPVARMLHHVGFVYLANTASLYYSLTIICCCQVQNYIYWLISTENDHRHHHKFIKYEKRLRKEGKNMLGLPIKQNLCHFSTSLDA
jgi:hypothetical protein